MDARLKIAGMTIQYNKKSFFEDDPLLLDKEIKHGGRIGEFTVV